MVLTLSIVFNLSLLVFVLIREDAMDKERTDFKNRLQARNVPDYKLLTQVEKITQPMKPYTTSEMKAMSLEEVKAKNEVEFKEILKHMDSQDKAKSSGGGWCF